MKIQYGRSHTFTQGMALLLGMKDFLSESERERGSINSVPGSTCLGSRY